MKQQPNMVIRMNASEWSVTVFHENTATTFDLRRMDKETRRKVIFKCVEAFRIHRDNLARAA